MSEKLNELLDEVVDGISMVAFVDALTMDRIAEVDAQKQNGVDLCGRGPTGWESYTTFAKRQNVKCN